MSVIATAGVPRGERRAELLALGFGTSVAMWAVGYLARLQPGLVPAAPLLVLLCLVLIGGGFVAGRLTGRDWRGGLAVGALASLLNLLILGSVLGGETPSEIAQNALLWIPGTIAAGALLAALGAMLSGMRRADTTIGASWNSRLAGVTAAATLLLLGAGGLVTSQEAGLAVTDWPNSFGTNMFLYPLSRMTGGVYYEHAHRLLGSLVGLCTLILALQLQLSERRGWVRRLGWLTLAAVVIQGVLGGLRVTGRFTLSQDAADMAPSLALAVVHGVLGQLCLGLMVGIAAFTSRAWTAGTAPLRRDTAATDRQLAPVLLALLVAQLLLGALLRHFAWGLMAHVSFAVIVILVAVAAGARAWGLYGELAILRRVGRALVILVGLQLLLGTAALIAVNATPEAGDIPAWEATLATFHQITGAALLACAVLLAVWLRRLTEAGATSA